jgi:8-oxo-dGTP pyrophosphatase MutT (NUDIX family)
MIYVVHGIYIENKSLLVLKKGKEYIFPGGKRNLGELDKKCLEREVSEELSDSKIIVGKYYKTFFGITPNSKMDLIDKTYFIYFENFIGEPSAEINEKRFVNSKNLPNLNLTEISRKILTSLIKEGLIK